ncbi:MAG: hypothetical protein PVJ57_04535 [Phycisphaerae bacterium]|jgi:hypothetical protein
MKLRSAPILGCFAILLTLADYHFDCRDLGGAGLMDGLWLAAAVTNAENGDAELQGEIEGVQDQIDNLSGQVDTIQTEQQQPGVPGENGLSCWDLNGNGVADPEEDINGDGNFDAYDCQGTDGTNGTDGISCWDLNGNGVGDPDEDVSGPEGIPDGAYNAWDCQGADGTSGGPGLACWDLNGNYAGDPDEDISGPDGVPDGNFDAYDCQGADGEDGEDGEDLRGVVARGRIDGITGLAFEATNLTSDLAQPGQFGLYEIVADVRNVGFDRLANAQSVDFPVFITVRAYVDGDDATTPFLGFYQFEPIQPGAPDPDPALHIDEANGIATLTFKVRIIDVRDGELARPGDFSVLVLEP